MLGIYVRLSREDENKKEISESIINQIEFLKSYCEQNRFKVVDIYSDDRHFRNNI